MKRLFVLGLGGLVWLTAGCASTAIPSQSLMQSKASVRAAEAVGAENNPRGALHLKMARDQITQAEEFIAEDENEKAALMLVRADADAELALAMAREQAAREQAREAKRQVDDLRQQMQQE